MVVIHKANRIFLVWSIYGVSSLFAILPMREQFQMACMALKAGEAGTALGLFQEFDQWYGSEQAVQDPAFREGWFRLWGLCALQMGDLSRGAELLETWLAEFPGQPAFTAFIRFQLAEAYGYLRETEKMIHHWSTFLMENPELPECLLVRWKWADFLIQNGQQAEARIHLEALLETETLSASSKSLATTAIALIELSEGNVREAFARLGSTGDNPACLLWKAICAPLLIKGLMENDEPGKALSACAWLRSPEDQKNRLQQLEKIVGNKHPGGWPAYPRLAIWSRHWQIQMKKLEAALDAIKSPHGESRSYPLILNALLKAEKSREAVVLGMALLTSNRHDEPVLRAWAYRAAIEGHLAIQQWPEANEKIQEFLEAYPSDPALPDILFLSARISAERRDFAVAVEQISRLLESYPENRSLRSWKMIRAEWLLQGGNPGAAMEALIELKDSVPGSWQPWLVFQTGRCHEALKNWEKAVQCYTRVEEDVMASSAQQEFAHTALLKLFLRTGNRASFKTALKRYEESFPEGMNRPVVLNLAGSFFAGIGETEKAARRFLEVAASGHPLAAYALEQLSVLYRKSGDAERLLVHSRSWIVQGLKNGSPLPPTPFRDLQRLHIKTGKPSFDRELQSLLIDEIERESLLVPANPMLTALMGEWKAREHEADRVLSFEDWCRNRAENCLLAGSTTAYACYQLFLADQLELEGRMDSADTMRIEVLKNADPLAMDEYSLYRAALTAGKYDFPETESMARTFLARFRQSEKVPEMLLQLAEQQYTDGRIESALSLLRKLRTDWPDADVYPTACLLAAKWNLILKFPEEAINCLSPLFEQPSLDPWLMAMSLLHRAQADLLIGNTERARLGLLRLLNLYPDFHDITKEAAALAAEHRLSGIAA